jgi:hypothetical protein
MWKYLDLAIKLIHGSSLCQIVKLMLFSDSLSSDTPSLSLLGLALTILRLVLLSLGIAPKYSLYEKKAWNIKKLQKGSALKS